MGLDRRAKSALTVLIVVIVLLFAMVIRNSVVALNADEKVGAAVPDSEDELIQIGGHTVLLRQGSTGNRIAHWLHAGSKNSRAFELGEKSFAPGSEALSTNGQSRINAFAQMMTHLPQLKARVVETKRGANEPLAERREIVVRAALIERGVPAARIDISDKPIEGGGSLSKQPELVLVLSA